MDLTSYLKSIILFDRKNMQRLANDEKATVPAIIIVVITAIASTFHWIISPNMNSNGRLLSAVGNFFAVSSQVFLIIFFVIMILHLLGIPIRNEQCLRVFGFAQLWNLIGYILAAIVIITEIPHGFLFMDLFLNMIPRRNQMLIYRFCYRYFQIFGLLSLISFLYGVKLLSNQERTSKIPLGRYQLLVEITTLLILVGVASILSYYVVSAYNISNCLVGEWELIWSTTGPGTFFPWPVPSGPEQALSRSDNLVDFILFTFFIQTGILLILTALLWALIVIIIFKREFHVKLLILTALLWALIVIISFRYVLYMLGFNYGYSFLR